MIKFNFSFEGEIEELKEVIMRIAMHPAENAVILDKKAGSAVPRSIPGPKASKPGRSKYEKNITVELGKNIIAKRNPSSIQEAIKAIMEDCGVSASAVGRMVNLNSFMVLAAMKGTVYPKTKKAFKEVLGFECRPVSLLPAPAAQDTTTAAGNESEVNQ
ncbi:MAG: hypothetical protein WCI51_01020 [Lentisphaerota bacterium]